MAEKKPEIHRRGLLTIAVVFGGMFVMFFMFAAVALLYVNETAWDFGDGAKIGVVEVTGAIGDSKKIVKDLKRFRKDESIHGIVVRVDSPGGSVAPSQEILQAIRAAGDEKPIAVSMGSTAASGGYYVALGAHRIFANPGTVTGSIGVVTQLFDVHEVLDSVNVEVNTITSGPYKDAGSPFREMSLEDEVHFRQLIDDVYEQFVEDVAAARKLDRADVEKIADGRVYTGRQAHALALVDELGSLQDAVDWVAERADVEGEVRLIYPPEESDFVADLLGASMRSVVEESRAAATPVLEYRYLGPQ